MVNFKMMSTSFDIQGAILEGVTMAGFSIPMQVIKRISAMPVADTLQWAPISRVLSEVLLERLSIQGEAWTWINRTSIPKDYESDLLNQTVALFVDGAAELDSHVASSFAGYIDPRLAAYLSLPHLAPVQWRRDYVQMKKQVAQEAASLVQTFAPMCNASEDVKAVDVRRVVNQMCLEKGLPLEYVQHKGRDVFEFPLGSVLDLQITGRLEISVRGRRPYVDFSLASFGKTDGLRARIGMEMIVSPYGNIYVAQRETRRETFINICFGLVVFSSAAKYLRGLER
jgi:hypothetical protein